MDEIEVIETVLIQHGTVPGGSCTCGHKYPLGASIAHHRALNVYAALLLRRAGVPLDQVVDAAKNSIALSEHGAG